MKLDDSETTEVMALIKRCNNGKVKPDDLQAIRKYLKEVDGLWKMGGDLAQMARSRIIKEAAPDNQLVVESIEIGLEKLKADLGYSTSPRLEKMLIEEICYCWMAHNLTSRRYAAVVTDGQTTLTQGDYWERTMTTSQKRYLRALETLARVRKMLPPVQINIAAAGGQQVNQITT